MVNEKLSTKVIKDLEFMAKKLKKRISILEKNNDATDVDITVQITALSDEYRRLKREIVEISNMTFTGGRQDG